MPASTCRAIGRCMPAIYEGEDTFVERVQSYGVHEKPADYLESFNDFIRRQLNQSVALGVVVNRPRDLTRETLKEVRLLLDGAGYSEAALENAWRNATNQENAATDGGIRQLNVVLDDQLDEVLNALNTGLWQAG